MIPFTFILMLIVCILLGCAALNVPPPHPRLSWFPAGMFIWAIKVTLPMVGLAG